MQTTAWLTNLIIFYNQFYFKNGLVSIWNSLFRLENREEEPNLLEMELNSAYTSKDDSRKAQISEPLVQVGDIVGHAAARNEEKESPHHVD